MDAFFNALKARFQKGGTVKRPTGAKIDTTGEKAKEAREKGRGMDPKTKTKKRVNWDPKAKTPATDEQKKKMKDASKKNFPKGIGGRK